MSHTKKKDMDDKEVLTSIARFLYESSGKIRDVKRYLVKFEGLSTREANDIADSVLLEEWLDNPKSLR